MKFPIFQQGGAAPAPQQEAQNGGQDVQKQVVALVQAAMSGNQKAQQQVQSIIDAAKQGDQQALQLAQMIQQVMQAIKGQARSAKIGAKLNYIHLLRTGVNADEEVIYERCGGKVTKKVVKKAACGSKAPKDACGGKTIKNKAYFDKCGKKLKKCYFGGTL